MTARLLLPLLLLAVCVVYAGLWSAGFQALDDQAWVVSNQHVQDGLDPDSIRWAFTTDFGGAWQPLVWMSWMADRTLFGDGPRGFHLTNLLLHLLATGLLFGATRRLFGSGGLALAVAALYALHPVQVESVAWIAERKGLLAAVFWMIALEAYSRVAVSGHRAAHFVVFAAMLLGLMAKSTLLVLPFVLLLLDVWPRRTLDRPGALPAMLREKAALLVLVPVFLVVGYAAQEGFGAVRDVGLPGRIGTACVAYLRSAGHLLAPLRLSPLYVEPAGGFGAGSVLGSAAVLVAVTVAALRFGRALPGFRLGWLWFLGTLLPFSGLVPVGGHFMADRYLLIPSIGIWIALADLARAGWARAGLDRRVGLGAFAIVLALLAAGTASQVRYWQGPTRLFERAVEVDPQNHLAHYWLGESLARAGDPSGAAQQFEAARTINPAYDLAWFQEGTALLQTGRLPEAAHAFERYLALRPNQFKGWMNLGASFGRMGRHDDALRCFERAVEIAPDHPQALANRDRARELAGSPER